MSVNVNRSVSDQFYRYKMPRLIAKVNRSPSSSSSVCTSFRKTFQEIMFLFVLFLRQYKLLLICYKYLCSSRWKAKGMESRQSLSTWLMLQRH